MDSKTNILGKEITKGVSIITASMNRNEFIEKTLNSWFIDKVDEIIIVDWGNTGVIQIVEKIIKNLKDTIKYPNIIVVIVPEKKYWILSYAFNIAARFSSKKNILKLDADSKLNSDFFKKHPLNNEIFYAGDWRLARDENEKHTNGIMYVKRKHFFNVFGYNEYIQTYGWDDCDMYDRLSLTLERNVINLDTIQHIKHDENLRTKNQLIDSNGLDVEIEKNRLISLETKWSGPMLSIDSINFEVCSLDKLTKIICKTSKIVSVLSREIMEICREKAIKNREYERNKKLKEKKKLYIQTQNGLGNRLRAFASAFCIATYSNIKRDLILIWETNEHCEAKFSDLYDVESLTKFIKSIGINFQILEKNPGIRSDINVSEDLNMEKFDKYNYMNDNEKNTYIDENNNNNIYIISACCLVNKNTNWERECDFLRQMKPCLIVQKMLSDFDSKNNIKIESCIGVHIRMSQPGMSYEDTSNWTEEAKKSVEKWRTASHWENFLTEIDKILLVDKKQKFFLCCDNKDAYVQLIKKRSGIFVYTNKNVFDRSIVQVQNALLDLILLSKTKEILGSNWSTFTEIANRLGGKKLRLAGKDF